MNNETKYFNWIKQAQAIEAQHKGSYLVDTCIDRENSAHISEENNREEFYSMMLLSAKSAFIIRKEDQNIN